ncbi:MAG: sugar ABC transporter substrate-binding protein [Clostridiales bacterium]|nr:sugar ABC transporter substrate-binding protein [Clostridiales bacterium]
MRKIIAAILALAMILSLCSFAVAEQEPITVTVFRGDPGDQPTEDNKIYKMIEEQFGIKFEIEFLAGDLDETLGTKIAGEDYPDLFDGGNSAEKLINAGALINLLDYINEESTPNLWNHIKDLLPQLVNENGELFIIPNYGINYNAQIQMACNGPAFFIQKQVLAWDNYPQIKTLDQYFDLIERFIAANPTDENGAKYEGFAILCEDWRHFCLINPVQHLMGQPNEGEVYINRTADENGIYAVETFIDKPYAKAYYAKLNEAYNKGLINPDTFTMTYDQYIAKLSAGTVLGMFDQTWDFGTATAALETAGMYKNTYIALPLVYDESYGFGTISEQYLNGAVPNKDRGFGISVNCEYPERMIQLFEALLSDEWQKILQWGIEGEDYYVENGRMLMTQEQYSQRNDATWKMANTALTIWESAPKKQGTQDDGNAWAPADQGENYFALMSDYDKEFLTAYGYLKPADFFNAPCELAPWGEAWQIDKAPIQDDYDKFLLIQDQQLPKIIMSADQAELDTNWDAFVTEIAPYAQIYTDFMQAEVTKLVEQTAE